MRRTNKPAECLTVEPTQQIASLNEDILNNFLHQPRSLSPKYFYDDRGSDLFTQICDTPEYYPTRTEDSLLNQYCIDIITKSQPNQIIELGSGNSQKTRHLFNACETLGTYCRYLPFDVCESILVESSQELHEEYPWLDIQPLQGDFYAGLGNLPQNHNKNLYIFLGGSIGNFTPEKAGQFLKELYQTMNDGDFFLLGADRKKEPSVLNAAYNDAQGITAEFNLNVLNVINHELDANFNINEFEHSAHFNDMLDRIEMHLISKKDQTVDLNRLNEQVEISQGEKILTEISCKYSFDKLETLLRNAGFNIEQHYQPINNYFSLVLAKKNIT